MNKFFPLLITTIITIAFVVMKKSVITALPEFNKIIKTCPSESNVSKYPQLKHDENQAKKNSHTLDSIVSFRFTREYTFQHNKKQAKEHKYYFSYWSNMGEERQCENNPSCIK